MVSDWGIVFVFLMLSGDVLFLLLPFLFSLVVVSRGGLLFGGGFGFEDCRCLFIRVICVVFRDR